MWSASKCACAMLWLFIFHFFLLYSVATNNDIFFHLAIVIVIKTTKALRLCENFLFVHFVQFVQDHGHIIQMKMWFSFYLLKNWKQQINNLPVLSVEQYQPMNNIDIVWKYEMTMKWKSLSANGFSIELKPALLPSSIDYYHKKLEFLKGHRLIQSDFDHILDYWMRPSSFAGLLHSKETAASISWNGRLLSKSLL